MLCTNIKLNFLRQFLPIMEYRAIKKIPLEQENSRGISIHASREAKPPNRALCVHYIQQ